MDKTLLVVVLGLLTLGLIMDFSSTIGYIRPATGEIASRFFVSQLGAAALGLAVMFGISRIDYALLRRLALPFMAITLLLLVAVFFTPSRNGARRWFGRPFQPSELAKTAIITTATWLFAARTS
jgi:cell division protein FtsW